MKTFCREKRNEKRGVCMPESCAVALPAFLAFQYRIPTHWASLTHKFGQLYVISCFLKGNLRQQPKKQVCRNINNMYLQVLSSAIGSSCGTVKFHRDKG